MHINVYHTISHKNLFHVRARVVIRHSKLNFQSQTSSPENPFSKSNMDDFDFVDVEGEMEERNSKKKDVLEEGTCNTYNSNFLSHLKCRVDVAS